MTDDSLRPAVDLRGKLHEFVGRLGYVPATLRLVREAAGHLFTWWIVVLVIQGLLPVASVYLTRAVVDRLAAVVAGPAAPVGASIAAVMGLGAALVAVLFGAEGLRAAADYLRSLQATLVQDHISDLVHKQSTSVDLAFYEWPEFFDHLHRAQAEATSRPLLLIESLGTLLQNGLTLVAMAGLLLTYGWWMPLALLASAVPALWVVLRYSVRQHQWRQRTTADERRSWYYSWLMTTAESAAEIRLFGLARHLQNLFGGIRRRLRDESKSLAADNAWTKLVAGGVALSVTAATVGWMLYRAAGHRATLGDLAFLYQAFSNGQRMTQALLQQVGQLYYHSLFLGDLFQFLAFAPRVVDPPDPQPLPKDLTGGIRLQQVTFAYPDAAEPALRDFSLEIPAGQFVALVGPNGAGKSTLVKLLCRFYDPRGGSIELAGRDLRSLSLDVLRARLSVLFQQPMRFNATVHDNIAWGNLAAQPGRADVVAAAAAAGATELIERLPRQYDQLLGKWYASGTELSVGQWQRLALARAFLRRADILILDEPTSAMDPWAEADWLQRFRQLAAGRTVLLITHRFTSAMYADVIHVLVEGQVVESGSHEQLIAAGGRYAGSWLQRRPPGPGPRAPDS
jgi:ATP-binding cassette, subfamily B, bacterial